MARSHNQQGYGLFGAALKLETRIRNAGWRFWKWRLGHGLKDMVVEYRREKAAGEHSSGYWLD